MLSPADVQIEKELYSDDEAELIKDYYKRKDIDLEDILKDIVDVYVYNTSELTINDTLGNTEAAKANNPDIADNIDSSYFDAYYSEDIMKLSDYNKVAALYGNEQYSLSSDEYIIVADFKSMAEVRNKALDKGVKIALNGELLKPKYNRCSDGFVQMSSNHINIGIVVVPDEVLETMLPTGEYYIGNYNIPEGDEREAVDKKIVKIANGAGKEGIIMDINTLISVKENSMGLGAMIAFIALYIGLIFLISGAAILALKELSESAEFLAALKEIDEANLGVMNLLPIPALDGGAKLSLATANGYAHFRCSQYKRTSRTQNCTQHYIREDALNQLVLKQLQHFLSYLQQFERVFIRRQIDTTLAERRYELSAKQKQIEKDEKRMDELDRLFRKIYEDNVSGKLNDERFYKLSDGYEAEQGQLKREIEALTAEVSQADMEVTNVAKLIAVTKKYTRIDELTPEILNAFVDKIVIHEREKKDGKRTQQIDIYYSYVGIVDIPTDEEMREMEREYMRRTTRQTA